MVFIYLIIKILFIGMFYLGDSSLTSLGEIQISNSVFSQIKSDGGNGTIAYFDIRSYEKILVVNCTFEYCTGASSGGVFHLDTNTNYTYLDNVKFMYNDATRGVDIYCSRATCMSKVVTPDNPPVVEMVVKDTCSTSSISIQREGSDINPNYIPLCPNSCIDSDDSSKCKDDCVKF
jgi:hypothetical protein